VLATKPDADAGHAIQPAVFHLTLSGDLRVQCVSANISDTLSVPAADCLGRTMAELFPAETVHDMRNRMALLRDEGSVEHLFGCELVDGANPVDVSIYRAGDGFGVDGESQVDHRFGDVTGLIEGMLARLKPGNDLNALATAGAGQIRSLTGYDSVSIHLRGQLVGHSGRGPTPPEMTLAPAEIPFMVIDRTADPVAIVTADRNYCAIARSELRAVRADEALWLDSAGAKAAFLFPLASEGEILGHACCISTRPRHISPKRRGVAKLFGTLVALRLQVAELRSLRSG